FSTRPRPPSPPRFPYPTLFRSRTIIDVLRGVKKIEEVLPEVEQVHPLSAFLQASLAQDSAPAPRRRDGHRAGAAARGRSPGRETDRKSTRLNSSHVSMSYAVFC